MRKKTVVITGAGSGIGKACAEVFATSGYQVVINGRREDRLHQLKTELAALGCGEVLLVPGDVSSEADCRSLIEKAVGAFGGIDVLINNAGISMRALVEEVDLQVLHQVMNVNFWGTVYCTKYALPHLLKSSGSVVGVSSIAGKKGLPGRAGYSASKFAMEGFLESLRIENRKKNLHVLIACPGFTASEIRQTALSANGQVQGESPRDERKMMTSSEVARHIFDAVTQRRRSMVLTTNGKLTVLLNKFFPSFVDKLVFNHMAAEPGSPFR